jgi:AraC-like DNA-binding protein
MVLIEPGEVHEVFPGGVPWAFDTLYLDEEALQDMDGMSGRCPTSTSPVALATDARLAESFSRLHRAVVDGSPIIEQDEALVGLVGALENGRSEPSRRLPGRMALDRVREFLDECPGEDISLADLAVLADLSTSHLSRSFRREFGLPPHAYLIQARVRRARSLLRRGNPVIEVAALVGFADQAHLTRHFRRLVDVTPGLYRSGGRIVQDRPDDGPYPGWSPSPGGGPE